MILAMTEEFESTQGCVTCEVAIHKDKLNEFGSFIEDVQTVYGKWIAMTCEVCVGYRGPNHLHLSLEKIKLIEYFKNLPEFIKIFNE